MPTVARAGPAGMRQAGGMPNCPAALLCLGLLLATGAPSVHASPGQASQAEPADLDALVAALRSVADSAADLPNVRADYARLAARHGLPDSPEARVEYARVKLAFEATREGGWWWVRYRITNREPQSDAIWRAWASPRTGATAEAECDELSALFAFLARRLGVVHVGLLWPTWNHTIAVWRPMAAPERVRVLAPTSQVWLSPDEGLDTDRFDAWEQRRVYDYGRTDAPGSTRLAPGLASFFLETARRQIGASEATLLDLRELRVAVMSGQIQPEEAVETARALAEGGIGGPDPEADRAVLLGLGWEVRERL